MNYKYLKNFSFFFSIIFLVIITFLISFIFFVSEKPLKINVLNFFDRQSVILKKKNVTEIGDIYISFNKLSKKFEFLIENIVIDELFFPSVLINVDLSISDNFFNTSLKLFDGEISYRKKDKEEN